MRRLARLLASFALALAVFQAVGSRLPGVRIACVETCPDDDDQGACPPACDCACRAPHRISLAAPAALPEPALCGEAFVATAATTPPEPDPRALLHVPRALLD